MAIEDLTVRNMVKNHSLAQTISDAAWRDMRSMPEYKCAWCGRDLVVVDRRFPSSKLCGACGTSPGRHPYAAAAGPGEGDVVRQFRSYRRVRTELWSGAQRDEETGRVVDEFLLGYEVDDPDARAALITERLGGQSAAPSGQPEPGSGGRPR